VLGLGGFVSARHIKASNVSSSIPIKMLAESGFVRLFKNVFVGNQTPHIQTPSHEAILDICHIIVRLKSLHNGEHIGALLGSEHTFSSILIDSFGKMEFSWQGDGQNSRPTFESYFLRWSASRINQKRSPFKHQIATVFFGSSLLVNSLPNCYGEIRPQLKLGRVVQGVGQVPQMFGVFRHQASLPNKRDQGQYERPYCDSLRPRQEFVPSPAHINTGHHYAGDDQQYSDTSQPFQHDGEKVAQSDVKIFFDGISLSLRPSGVWDHCERTLADSFRTCFGIGWEK